MNPVSTSVRDFSFEVEMQSHGMGGRVRYVDMVHRIYLLPLAPVMVAYLYNCTYSWSIPRPRSRALGTVCVCGVAVQCSTFAFMSPATSSFSYS